MTICTTTFYCSSSSSSSSGSSSSSSSSGSSSSSSSRTLRLTPVMLLFLWCSLLALPVRVRSQYPIVQFRFGSQPVAAEVGDRNVKLVCLQNTDRGSAYVNATLEHVNPVTSQRRLLGRLVGVTPRDVAPGYDLAASEKGGIKTIAITIVTVGVRDDGRFVCTVTASSPNGQSESAGVEVIVIRRLSSLRLQFGERFPVGSKPQDPITVESGSHPVRCIAEGSNPPTTNVMLLLDGRPVALAGKPEVALMKEEGEGQHERRYRTTTLSHAVIPEDGGSSHQLQCRARDMSGKELSTELDVKAAVPDVEDVQCQTQGVAAAATASGQSQGQGQGQDGSGGSPRAVALVCTVDHARMDVFSFAFQVGKTGQVIRARQGEASGGDNDDAKADDDDDDPVLTTRQLSEGRTQVVLTVSRPQDWHFESDLYLLINTTHRHLMKESFRLRKSEPEEMRTGKQPHSSGGGDSGGGDSAGSGGSTDEHCATCGSSSCFAKALSTWIAAVFVAALCSQ